MKTVRISSSDIENMTQKLQKLTGKTSNRTNTQTNPHINAWQRKQSSTNDNRTQNITRHCKINK